MGGGGLLIVMVGSEKKENGLLTGLPFQGRQAGYTTQTPSEREACRVPGMEIERGGAGDGWTY